MRKIRNARLRNRGHYKLNNKNIINIFTKKDIKDIKQ